MAKPFVRLAFAYDGQVFTLVADPTSMTGIAMTYDEAKVLRDELSMAIDAYTEWVEETGEDDDG